MCFTILMQDVEVKSPVVVIIVSYLYQGHLSTLTNVPIDIRSAKFNWKF